ncbi:MAG: class I SAM-dependent methyltransferase [Thermodesulfobacteriota bacterium]
MKKTRLNSATDGINDALRLQRGLYTSRNPTRKWLHTSRLQWLIDTAGRYFPPGAKGPVIDIGTGCGILLPALSRHFESVIALDLETEFLKQVKTGFKENKAMQWLAGDARFLPIRDNVADLVVCAEVLEHIDSGLVCLKEIYRVLKPGGILLLSTPQPFSLLEITAGILLRRPVISLVRKIYREPVLPTGHINLMTSRRLNESLARIGFTVLEIHKSGLYLPGLAETSARFAQRLAAALNTRLFNTKLDFLLWTQFFVAGKPAAGRGRPRPAKEQP